MIEVDLVGLLDGELENNRISAWMQTGRNDVGDGICMGMCLDWMRRILTGMTKKRIENRWSAIASTSYFGSKTKDSNRWEQQKNTHRVFRDVQARVVSKWHYEEEVAAAIGRIRRNPVFANVNTLADARTILDQGPPGQHDPHYMERWNKMADDYEREMRTMEANLADPRAAHRVRMAKQSEILDALASVDSSILPRSTVKWTRPHSFSGLRVDGLTLQLVQASLTEMDFLHFVEGRLDSLGDDRCGVLSMGRFGASGHDVAFYVGRNRTFFSYFDPTMGEFYFSRTEWTRLGKLLAASWRTFYGARNYDWLSWTNYAARG